jgi:hypothetical protein
MLVRIAVLLSAFQLMTPVVDRIPELDVSGICAAPARSGITEMNQQTCLSLEQKAKLQLALEWPNYAPADRASCLQMSTAVGPSSYVEILTCLEMAVHAKRVTRPRGPGSLVSGEGKPRDFQGGCASQAGPARPELTPDSCF